MQGSSYWERLNRRRLSRRRLLVGAAGIGAGLVASSLVGCGGGQDDAVAPTGSPAATATPFSFGVPQVQEPAKSRGGTYRYYSFDPAPLDSFDPHQTQFGPIYQMHSAVFSKVLKYEDVYEGTIVPDLAESVPETADKLTYVIKVRPNVRFQDTEKIRENFPQVAGRQLTAEDVKYSIERQTNKESPRSGLYYRASQWETVDKIEVVDPLTLRITTKIPTAPFVHYLADTNAFIIARELVDSAKDDMNSLDKMVGTGPFILEKFIGLKDEQIKNTVDDDAAGPIIKSVFRTPFRAALVSAHSQKERTKLEDLLQDPTAYDLPLIGVHVLDENHIVIRWIEFVNTVFERENNARGKIGRYRSTIANSKYDVSRKRLTPVLRTKLDKLMGSSVSEYDYSVIDLRVVGVTVANLHSSLSAPIEVLSPTASLTKFADI